MTRWAPKSYLVPARDILVNMTDLRRRTFGPHPTAQDWRAAPKADIEQALAADVIRRNPRLYAGHDADAVKFVRNTMGPTKWDLLLAAEAHGLAPQGTYLYPGERKRQPPPKTSTLGSVPGRRAHAQKRAALLKDMAPGLRGVAQRSVDAENRFLAYAMEHGDLSRAQAQRALTAFRKAHVIKFDPVNGTFHVKHGQFLDPDVLRRVAGLES